jgi:hypothetical protein
VWWIWRPRRGIGPWIVLCAIAFATALFAAGSFDATVVSWGGWRSPFRGLPVEAVTASFAPGAPTSMALRIVLLSTFGQSLHYAIWLRLIPEDDRPQPTPRPFASSWRALLADIGPFWLAAGVLGTLGFLGWALYDVPAARAAYLRSTASHTYLELAILAIRLVKRPA